MAKRPGIDLGWVPGGYLTSDMRSIQPHELERPPEFDLSAACQVYRRMTVRNVDAVIGSCIRKEKDARDTVELYWPGLSLTSREVCVAELRKKLSDLSNQRFPYRYSALEPCLSLRADVQRQLADVKEGQRSPESRMLSDTSRGTVDRDGTSNEAIFRAQRIAIEFAGAKGETLQHFANRLRTSPKLIEEFILGVQRDGDDPVEGLRALEAYALQSRRRMPP